MKPVYQTKFGKGNGNCFQAALASILELPLDDVPHFMVEEGWERHLEEWLAARGLGVVWVGNSGIESITSRSITKTPCIASVKLNPGDVLHSVIAQGGRIIHDPHPTSDVHTLSDILDYFILYPLDPSFLRGRT